jgi:hypothetical protein
MESRMAIESDVKLSPNDLTFGDKAWNHFTKVKKNPFVEFPDFSHNLCNKYIPPEQRVTIFSNFFLATNSPEKVQYSRGVRPVSTEVKHLVLPQS